MASEILQRNPTSTGNRKVFTWTGWIKFNKLSSTANTIWYVASSGGSEFIISIVSSTGRLNVYDYSSSAYQYQYQTDRALRDFSNWFHLVVAVDTTHNREDDRFKIYVNGVLYNGSYATETVNGGINYNTRMNSPGEINTIGQNTAGGANYDANCQLTDVFMVDGQALTPDVFGFYKDGKGYQSSGSTKATDFRPGQWSPHSPRKIKSDIERRGGFGVNGFYLPMNDSSNFGADFHCDIDSIIKLKGEDLPQPRNGLPTTSDNYVSQLRSDPYAANLVLAVPGVNTQPTGSELLTNGTFDTNVSGWTVTDTGTIVRQSDGTAKVTRGSSAEVVYQDITTVVGTTYEVSVDITDIGGSHGQVYVKSIPHSGSLNTNIGYSFYTGTYKGTFTADTTTTRIYLYAHPSGYTSYDNVSVKATTIRDYHADIKGSGTNKTLTGYDAAGVRNPNGADGFNVNGYYGSALHFDGSTDYIDVAASSDYNLGSGDYTIECWVNPRTITTSGHYKRIWDLGSGLNNSLSMTMQSTDNSFKFRYNDGIILQSPSNSVNLSQWSHVVLERHGSKLSLYLNGVVVDIETNHTVSYNYSSNTFRIGRNHDTSSNGLASSTYGFIQDLRVYKGVAKYKGGFDVPKPYNPNRSLENWRQVPDTCKNNFATLNELDAVTSNQSGTDYTQATHSNGSLTVILSDDFSSARGSIGISTGKYYWEIRIDDNYNATGMGVIAPGNQLTSYNAGANGASYEPRSDRFRKNGVNFYDGTNNKTDDGLIVGVALDKNVGIVSFFADGTLLSNGTMTGLNALSDVHIPECFTYNDGSNVDNTYTWNFGQNPTFSGQVTAGTNADASGKGLFKYAPPTGFLALCEDNLPTPAIADPGEHFKTVLWTGDGNSGRSITGVGFKPDFVWLKKRNDTTSQNWTDSVRGIGYTLFSDDTSADNTNMARLQSFDNDGFTVGNHTAVNNSGDTFVAWCWKAGGAAVANTDGSIASQVSVNQTAGFSIVSYTGTGSGGTVGHGLGKRPKIVLVKRRDASTNWPMFVDGISNNTNDFLQLNLTNATATAGNFFNSGNTTTTTFPLGTGDGQTNESGSGHIAYCWAEIEGYSKFGSYKGNGNANGPFVYCGFKPAWIMIKPYGSGNGCYSGGYTSWSIYDSSRSPVNDATMHERVLFANRSYAEGKRGNGASSGTFQNLDFVSNGFKIRGGSNCETNTTSINGFFFMAFAESPFQTANAK